MRRLIPLLLCAASAYGLTCSNSGSDPGNIQSAVNGGGTVTLSGTCSLGSSTIQINNSVTINGPATLNSSNAMVFSVNSNNVTISGLTLNGGYINFPIQTTSGFTFANSTIQNLTNAGCGGGSPGILASVLTHSTINNNTFRNIWPGGFPNTPPNCNDGTAGGNDTWGAAGIALSGLDYVTITNNTFDEIASDAMHLDWEATTGNSGGFSTHGNVVSYNTFSNIRRIPIEIQSQPSGNCPGGCNYGIINTNGLQVNGNYAHLYAFGYSDTWGASLVPDGSKTGEYLNNTFIANNNPSHGNMQSDYSAGMETSLDNGISQGNVFASVPSASYFFGAAHLYGGHSNNGYTLTVQNEIWCGNPNQVQTACEPGPGCDSGSPKILENYNYKNTSTCPAGSNPDVSNIVPTLTSANNQSFPSGGNGTWTAAVVSNLSIKWVQFKIDTGSPVVTQELQDVNSNFSNDRKWLYHATLNTSGYSAGSHTLTATATDVSGATQSASQTFVVGPGGPAPTISSFTASPTTVNAGGSSTLTWSTSGSTGLSISGIGTVTGTTVTVTPVTTTTYTLTATNGSGSATAAATVTVVPVASAPVIASFTASPASIVAGNLSTLSWSTANAASLSVSNGVGVVTGTSTPVNPAATTTYILTATNAVGSVTASATVTVTAAGTGTAWPTHVATAFDLLQMSDHSQTTLSGGVSATALTWPVSSPSTFVPYQVATVDGEQAKLCGVSSTALTICTAGRQFAGTTAATHATNGVLYGRIGAVYRNTLNARLIALEAALTTATRHGSYPGTSTGGASWPNHVATNQEMYVASDNAVSQLASGVTNSTLSWPLTSASNFVPYQIVLADQELAEICSAGTTLTLCSGTRGLDTSVAVAHSGGATVTGVIVDLEYNRFALELSHLEADLFGVAGSTSICSPCTAGAGASWPNHAVTAAELGIASPGGTISASFHNRSVAEMIALEADLAAHP